MTIVLELFRPTPLNRLYTPYIKNGKPSMRLSNEAKEAKKNIQLEALSKCKKNLLKGDISFYIDIDISSNKRPDIDALLKQLYDAFEGIYYENDKQIVDARQRIHKNQPKNRIVIGIFGA